MINSLSAVTCRFSWSVSLDYKVCWAAGSFDSALFVDRLVCFNVIHKD